MRALQESHQNGQVYTMVWGTDINVNDVQNQFTQFVRGFREQTGADAEGVPILEDEPKYMAYLQEVRRAHVLSCAVHERVARVPQAPHFECSASLPA